LIDGAAVLLTGLVASGCGGFTPGSSFDAGGGNDGIGTTAPGGDAGDSGGGGNGGDAQRLVSPDGSSGDKGDGSASDGSCSPNLTGRLRDFVNQPGFMPASALDDDFENMAGDDRGIVETDLGTDHKPVYAHGAASTATTHGQTQFDWWYRDTPGKNQPFAFTVPLTSAGGVLTYDNQEFFPLDGRGWDDEYVADDGKMHNFSFTFELHTTFGYKGGETFTFIGDDDVFVFINNKLVVDLGGVHNAETKSIMLDQLVTDDPAATKVPLTLGTTYPLDVFYNERHTVASHFRMDTSIAFNNCNPIVIPH
jgi:fibro-slime domain-containing protein